MVLKQTKLMKLTTNIIYISIGFTLFSCAPNIEPNKPKTSDKTHIQSADSLTNELISTTEKLDNLTKKSKTSLDSIGNAANEIIKKWEPIERFDPSESEYDTIISAK